MNFNNKKGIAFIPKEGLKFLMDSFTVSILTKSKNLALLSLSDE